MTVPYRCGLLTGFSVTRNFVMTVVVFMLIASAATQAFPVHGDQTVLPAGTELNEDSLDKPREIFKSEATGGVKSYLVNLGDLAFSAPGILGGVARRAGMSCATCHVNGASNAKLFVPGLSTRPGNFDTTGALFNSKANDGLLNPVIVPSLRGARYLSPYGHDGRIASLRDFIRNVVVNEFAGPEPSAAILDAMEAYIEDIDFLPNPRLDARGRLTGKISDAERRGEMLFNKAFPRDPNLSCAACHIPSAAFVDHRQHDVGSGGLFKTKTLRNANFNAPYFHDGRYDSYEQVIAHFDRVFELGLAALDRNDLVAYLKSIGDGERAIEPDSIDAQLKEIGDFASVLKTALPARDKEIVALAVETVGGELRELTDRFPDRKDTNISGGKAERNLARNALKELVLSLRRIEVAVTTDEFETADAELQRYGKLMTDTVPLLKNAEPWSLFNPAVHQAHYAALRQISKAANQQER